jgi:cysteine desulfurase/selenocysteine lyase
MLMTARPPGLRAGTGSLPTLSHKPGHLLDVDQLRRSFDFPLTGRIVTNNAATTQPPRQLLDEYRRRAMDYENVHRGQSAASRRTTQRFEAAYDTIAAFVNAPSRRSIVAYRGTTEAINAVMYSLLTEFADGDNVVTTMMEHNSNFVPWHGLTREILPRFGRRVECRVARFDHSTGRLDLDHLASLVDERTKLVCCTGASNFLGDKPSLAAVRRIADLSGYRRPRGGTGSLMLVDGAQLVPSTAVDVQALDIDYLAFSFHKLLAPFGVGVLYAREQLLAESLPFLYGGDMIADGSVHTDRVEYNDLPWKYAAGTPNILGTIVSAEALRLLVDLVGAAGPSELFRSAAPLRHADVQATMASVGIHTRALTEQALTGLQEIDGLRILGPADACARSPLVSFTVSGLDPFAIADGLARRSVESRAGCHCASLAHRDLQLDPPASCRLSFAVYTSPAEVASALAALRAVVRELR